MSTSAAIWELLEPEPSTVASLASALDGDTLLARLLALRGIERPQDALSFLEPSLRELPDPEKMKGALEGAARLAQAVIASERVTIYGDYDVDGVTSAALLYTFLGRLGLRARVFLPDRFVDGYGLNTKRLTELCDEGAELFVAVDCGTRAVEAIASVRARGLDFIVCDHHSPGPELPNTTAMLNPKQPGCTYPDSELAAVGVTLVLAQATRRALQRRGFFETRPPPVLGDLLEYAALGTIADVVPLKGVNRMISLHGLRRLGSSALLGVQALAARARLKTVREASHVGFALAPRINAAGRVADAKTAFSLLTTADPELADELADRVEAENNRRRALEREIKKAALALSETQQGRAHALVVASRGWHAGVLGIVASRLKDQFGVPTFVLNIEDTGLARGSGRSVTGYDLVAGLHALDTADSTLLTRFGGHAFAAGLTLPEDKIDALRRALVAHVAATWPENKRRAHVRIDAEITLPEVDLELIDRLSRLEPFGKSNPRPTFLLRGVIIGQLQLVGGDAWARLRLVPDNDRPIWGRRGLEAFCAADLVEGFKRGDRVDIVCRLERNTYRDKSTAQATLTHVALAGQPIATGPLSSQGPELG